MQELHAKIVNLYHHLCEMPALTPNAAVNRAFTQIVDTALTPLPADASQNLLESLDTSIGLNAIHSLCASGETELENHWAKAIALAENPVSLLATFPYLENYRRLVAMEVATIRQANPQATTALLGGSGPLPLTAYFLIQEHGFHVTCLDISPTANSMAAAWLNRVVPSSSVNWITADIGQLETMPICDVVWLCAMVFSHNASQQQQVLHHIQHIILPNQLLAVRSTYGLRTLLYPKVNCRGCTGLEFIAARHPTDDVVNSIILLRKRASKA